MVALVQWCNDSEWACCLTQGRVVALVQWCNDSEWSCCLTQAATAVKINLDLIDTSVRCH